MPRLRRSVERLDWEATRSVVDGRISRAIKSYIRSAGLSASAFGEGHSELAKLQNRSEPDYNHAGLPVAYGFKYLPRAVTSTLGAFFLAGDVDVPTSVLDIGAGSLPTALALNLIAPRARVELTAIEPSSAMVQLGSQIDVGAVSVFHERASLEDLLDHDQWDEQQFDFAIMNCLLSYRHRSASPEWWDQIGTAIGRLTSPPSTVVVIEPPDKQDIMNSLIAGLLNTGWYEEERFTSDEFPDDFTFEYDLQRLTTQRGHYLDLTPPETLTADARKLLGPPHPVSTWNPYQKQRVVILRERGTAGGDDLPFE